MEELRKRIADELRFINWPSLALVAVTLCVSIFVGMSLAILLFG